MDTLVNNDSLSAKYDEGVANRDPAALMDVAKESYGTPVATAAMHSADLIYKTSKEFDKLVTPIEKAGGAATPEGRMAFADSWKTVKDNPQWGDAMIMYLMGDKVGAANMVTGGAISDYTTYDQAGRQLRESRNALGQIVKVIDMETGNELDPREYGKRGGGQTTWENTLGGINAKETAKENTKLLNESITQKGIWSSAIDAAIPKAQEVIRLGSVIKGLDPKIQSKVWDSLSSSRSRSDYIGKSKQFLSSTNNGADLKDGEDVSKTRGFDAGLGQGPIIFDAKTQTLNNKSTGTSVNLNKLKQDTSADSSSTQMEEAFKQDQAGLAKYLLTSGLDTNQQTEVVRYFQLSNELNKDFAKLEAKSGKPSFLGSVPEVGYADPIKMGLLSAAGILSNKDVMDKHVRFFNDKAKNYPKGEVPNPAQIDSAFTKRPEFNQSMQGLADAWKNIMDMKLETRSSAPEPKKSAAVPPAAKSVGKPPVKKAPEKRSIDSFLND